MIAFGDLIYTFGGKDPDYSTATEIYDIAADQIEAACGAQHLLRLMGGIAAYLGRAGARRIDRI